MFIEVTIAGSGEEILLNAASIISVGIPQPRVQQEYATTGYPANAFVDMHCRVYVCETYLRIKAMLKGEN